ncbi:MAG: hypothetical protein AAF570_15985 [Bacteroidota bacterium]
MYRLRTTFFFAFLLLLSIPTFGQRKINKALCNCVDQMIVDKGEDPEQLLDKMANVLGYNREGSTGKIRRYFKSFFERIAAMEDPAPGHVDGIESPLSLDGPFAKCVDEVKVRYVQKLRPKSSATYFLLALSGLITPEVVDISKVGSGISGLLMKKRVDLSLMERAMLLITLGVSEYGEDVE